MDGRVESAVKFRVYQYKKIQNPLIIKKVVCSQSWPPKKFRIFEKNRKIFGDQLWEHTTFFLINRFLIFFNGSTRNFMADSMRQSKSDHFTKEKNNFTFGNIVSANSRFYIKYYENLLQFRETTLNKQNSASFVS